MSFLDTLKKTAGIAAQVTASAADTAVSKTRTMASIGRVKLAISSEEDKLKKAYTELGRLFYRDYQAQAEADMTEYQPWCDRAADAREQIQRLTQELEALKAEGKDAAKDAPKAQAEEKPEEIEDTSIFADMDDKPEVEIKVKVESKPEEQPEEADAPETAPKTAEEPKAAPETGTTEPAEAPAEQAPVVPESNPDIVGTFYIDTSNQDTEV